MIGRLILRGPLRALLSPQDRLVHAPLGRWADALLALFADAQNKDESEAISASTDCLNQAVLVELHRGRPEWARRLCVLQHHWLYRLWAKGRRDTAEFILQPMINLLRLDYHTGNFVQAYTQLDAFLKQAQGSAAHSIPQNPMEAALTDERLRRAIRSVYVIDGLKARLYNSRYSELLDFAEDANIDDREDLRPFVHEATILAHYYLGNRLQALNVAEAGLHSENSSVVIVSLIRFIEIAQELEMKAPQEFLDLLCVPLEQAMDADRLAVASRALDIAYLVEDAELAWRLSRLIAKHASELGDELGVWRASLSIVGAIGTPESSKWDALISKTARSTQYRQIRDEAQRLGLDLPATTLSPSFEMIVRHLELAA